MRNFTKYLAGGAIALSLAFSTGAFIKAYAARPAVNAAQPVDLTTAAEKALPAVVHIKYVQNSKIKTVEVQDPFGDFFDPFGFFGGGQGQGGTRKQQVQTPKKQATGSGVIISEDGYIVTNNHVVEGADELTVTLNDNSEYKATIIGTDKTTDLALIKISAKNLPAITIADSDKLKVGEWVLAVGNPFNLNSTVTAGIVSAKARSLGANGVESFIQTDAAINAGNSGGALVNTAGELVGINAMLYSQTGSYSGYGFAIPTTIMKKVVDDIKKYGEVQRAILGVAGIDAHKYIDTQKEQGNEVDLGVKDGIYVDTVDPDGAAAEAGIEKGDVITKIDGKEFTKMSEMQEYLYNKKPGDKVSITWQHNKKQQTKTVTLKNSKGNTDVVKANDLDLLGGQFRAITKEQKEQLKINYGLEVLKVGSGALKDAGIPKGYIIQRVNDQTIQTVEDLQEVIKDASKSKDPVLFISGVQSTGKKSYYTVPLEN